MLAEAIGGWLTGSLALLADAGHMLSDVAALGLSLFALRMARRPPTSRRTFGYHRMEILAALVNGAALVAISAFILVEAVQRLRQPVEVEGPLLLGIAAGGLLVNVASLFLLHEGRSESLNLRGAWLHVLTDALGSVQAIAAGALIWAFGWNWADPVASILISLLVTYSSWSLLKEATSVLLESAPNHIDVDEVRDAMSCIPGVCAIHDLHVWTITSGYDAVSAHVVVDETREGGLVLGDVRTTLHDRFGVHHITIQIEHQEFHCGPA
jgi:cobalt-zinc-cadmium efflux system protein